MSRGFTFIELLLGLVVLSWIGTMIVAATWGTFRTQRAIFERTVLQEIGTAAIAKIRDDLSQSFLVETSKEITFFRGEDNFDEDKLSFTAFAHSRSGPDTHESDQAEITYDLESDTFGSQLNHLRRRENRHLDGEEKEEGEVVVFATNVVSFNVEYSDGQSFRPSWDTRREEERNKLPKAVRISLLLRDQKEREENFEAVVEIPMAEGISVARPSRTPTPSAARTPGPTRTPR